MGDEYVDGPVHDPKRRKKLKRKTIWKILEGTMILKNELCDLHKHGWVFLFFMSFHSFYHSHLSYIESRSP